MQQLTLAHYRIGKVEPGEFVLMAGKDSEFLDEPIVKRTVHVELQRTDGVGYLLYGIALPMRIVVHRIDAPFIAGTVVFGMQDTVHDGVAQQHVRVRHVNLGTEHFLSVGEFAARMRAKRSRFSSTLRLRHGLSVPGTVTVPRVWRISSCDWSST